MAEGALQFSLAELEAVLPSALLFLTGLLVLIVDLFVPDETGAGSHSPKSHLVLIGVTGGLAALASIWLGDTLVGGVNSGEIFAGALRDDLFADFAVVLVVVATLLATLASGGYLAAQGENRGEFLALLYFGAGAMVLLAQANNLISIFVAIETLSIAVYVLAGFFRKWRESSEGALKYFIMGAFSSGFLLMGLVFIYGATESISLEALQYADDPVLLNVGLLLVLVGFCFKIGAVPFHSWVPDVYQGAPAMAAGWMAVAVKACSFAVLLRVVMATGGNNSSLSQLVAAIAIVTMILGNYAALNQTNIKRLLAYSGIAHTGTMLIPVALAFMDSSPPAAGASTLFYLAAYLLMTLGAFTVVAVVSNGERDREELSAFNGLARRYPLLALAFTIFLISLAGIPLTAGFMGKLYVFKFAIEGGFLYLAVIGILTTLVSVYYYIRPIQAMYFQDEEAPITLVDSSWGLHFA
ncbi:MAG: NADH-quinone oxidoreductase subunit N, partial [Planctomycetota bacterium]